MKKKDIILIIIIISFIYLPTILFFFLEEKTDKYDYEKRTLNKKPSLNIKTLSEYPKQYEDYYNDHIPFKNEIRTIRSKILYKYFKTGNNISIIVGKDGWLFYNSNNSEKYNSISDFRNTTSFSENEKIIIKDNLEKLNNKLFKKNIEFYLLIPPNKENVYSDYMPKIITRKNGHYSKTEDLINYLNNITNLKIIYPKNILINNRKNCDTYFKYDTHWNNYGAYLTSIELLNEMGTTLNYNNSINITKTDYGDLARMNIMLDKLTYKMPVIDFYNNIKYACSTQKEFHNCTSNNPINDKTILFIGDSFRELMIQYLAKVYKNSIFIHYDYYNEDLIKKYNPNIVVVEVTERLSKNLFKTQNIVELTK